MSSNNISVRYNPNDFPLPISWKICILANNMYIDEFIDILSKLSKKTDIRVKNVPIIISMMKKCMHNSNNYYMLCELLFQIVSQNNNTKEIYIDVIPVIISSMKYWIKNNNICKINMNTLFEIIGNNSELWRQCADAGGFSLFVDILKQNKYLCKDACIGLVNMLNSPHPDLITPNYHDAERICDNDGIKVLIDTLDHNFNDYEICEDICKILEYITSLSHKLTFDCVKLELIPILLDLLENYNNFNNNTYIITYSCNIIFYIYNYGLVDDYNCKKIIPIIVKLLINFTFYSDICLISSSILTLIIDKNEEYALIALNAEARNALIIVQQNNQDNDNLITITGKALHCIADKKFKTHPHTLNTRIHCGYCDICGSNAKKFMGCYQCDYDECMLCTIKY